jgi:hypothetical protein
MIRARHVSLVLAVVVLVAVIVGTGGFSSATVERGADINVVDDESAYLRVVINKSASAQSGNETTLLELTNQVGSPLNITTTVSSKNKDVTASDKTAPSRLKESETGSVTVIVSCTDGTSAKQVNTDIVVEIEASGPNVQIVMNRTVPSVQVKCTSENTSMSLASAESVSNGINTTSNETNMTDNETSTVTATPVNNESNTTTSVMTVTGSETTATDTTTNQSMTA